MNSNTSDIIKFTPNCSKASTPANPMRFKASKYFIQQITKNDLEGKGKINFLDNRVTINGKAYHFKLEPTKQSQTFLYRHKVDDSHVAEVFNNSLSLVFDQVPKVIPKKEENSKIQPVSFAISNSNLSTGQPESIEMNPINSTQNSIIQLSSLKTRAIQSLALKPMTHGELANKLGVQPSKIKSILLEISSFNSGTWSLHSQLYSEILLKEWPYYSEKDRVEIAEKMATVFTSLKLSKQSIAWKRVAPYQKKELIPDLTPSSKSSSVLNSTQCSPNTPITEAFSKPYQLNKTYKNMKSVNFQDSDLLAFSNQSRSPMSNMQPNTSKLIASQSKTTMNTVKIKKARTFSEVDQIPDFSLIGPDDILDLIHDLTPTQAKAKFISFHNSYRNLFRKIKSLHTFLSNYKQRYSDATTSEEKSAMYSKVQHFLDSQKGKELQCLIKEYRQSHSTMKRFKSLLTKAYTEPLEQ